MYLEARRCILSKLGCLLNCTAFGGSRVKTRRCIWGKKMYFEQTCVVYLIVRPSVGRGLDSEDASRVKKMFFEQTCVVYLIVRPSWVEG